MNNSLLALTLALMLASSVVGGCGSGDSGSTVYFDLSGTVDDEGRFFDFPWPSDLRRLENGKPDLRAYPDPRQTPLLQALRAVSKDRDNFPVMPVVYFRFDAALAERDLEIVEADSSAPVLLIDISPGEQQGSLTPVILKTFIREEWTPGYTLGVAPVPGLILEGGRSYAVVVMTSLADAEGNDLGRPGALSELIRGSAPSGLWGEQAREMYAPLWPVLEGLGVELEMVAAATVFTTGDIVTELAEFSDAVVEAFEVEIQELAMPADGEHADFCEVRGVISAPQFQQGQPPFDTEGLFELDEQGMPIEQRQEVLQFVAVLPKGEMPAEGFPLTYYFHGSGGSPDAIVNRGKTLSEDGDPTPGEGPGYVLAKRGIATAGASMPLNPDRLPSASAFEYINFKNLAAFRDTFRQGVLEARLIIEALEELEMAPALLADCSGISLPQGESAYRFNMDGIALMGQSMGGIYTNLVGAVEPKAEALVPTAGGGFWSVMILSTTVLTGAADLMSVVLGTDSLENSFMQPGMHLVTLAWEKADPSVCMPRASMRPLEGHPARHVFQPVGRDDVFFANDVYNAAVLATGNELAGELVWEYMLELLGLDGRGQLVDYPISENLNSAKGQTYTGVAVQYSDDGILNSHYIFAQLDEVKFQYSCFLKTFFDTGAGTVFAPATPFDTPCQGQRIWASGSYPSSTRAR